MKKIVLATLAVLTLAIALPIGGGFAATVSEAARMGDSNGHTGSQN